MKSKLCFLMILLVIQATTIQPAQQLQDNKKMQQNIPYPSKSNISIQFPSQNTFITSNTPAQKSKPSTKQCRICLQDHTQPNDVMVRPCKCLGSIKYVHESCMMKWIETTLRKKTHLQQQKLKTQGIQCQMCRYLIKFDMDLETKCRNYQDLKSQFMMKMTLYLLLFLVLTVSLIGIGGCIGWIMKQSLKATFFHILAIFGICLLSIFVILGLYVLLTQLFLFRELRVNKVFKKLKNQPKHRFFKSKNQVAPISDQLMNNSLHIIGFMPEITTRQ